MNNIILILLALYGFMSLIFFYYFFKNSFDFKMTIREIKVRLFSCCIKNKEEIEAKLGEERVKILTESLLDIEDCNSPEGFPFNICFSKDLEKEELILREKLLTILKNRKNKRLDGNIEKLVIPLEATLFLTKSLNPLVTENGEIQIISKHKKISEQLEEIMIALKDRDSDGETILYKDEEELLLAIKSLLEELKSETLLNNEELYTNPTIKKAEEIIHIQETKTLPFSAKDLDDMLPEQMFFPPEEETKKVIKKEENKPKKEENSSPFDESFSPFDDSSDEIDFSEIENQIYMEVETDLSDILSAELESIELEEEKSEDIPSFYKNLTYKTQNVPELDFSNIDSSIKKIFSNESAISALFRNLAKTKPLVFSDNKEVIFIDQNNMYFAISKIYGMDSKKLLDQFKSIKLKQITELNKALSDILEIYLSDLLSGHKNANKIILEENGNLFTSFGFVFQSRAFHKGLNQNEFDFFRSFPYNNNYKIKINSSDSGKDLPRLVTDIFSVEIK